MDSIGTTITQMLLESTAYGSGAILLAIAAAPLVRSWLGAQAAYALWFIVLLRLLIPWSPSWDIPRIPLAAPTWSSSHSTLVSSELTVSVSSMAVTHNPPPLPPAKLPLRIDWLLTIWAIGAFTIFTFLIVRATRAARLVRRARNITEDPLIQQFLTEIGVRSRRLKVCETGELQSPALCGLLRPSILLPIGWADAMSPADLRCVLLHEYGHHRRRDIWWKLAFQISLALHWFNPLVWLAYRISRTDQEMACDEWSLTHLSDADPFKYGETLLTTARQINRSAVTSPVHAGMAEIKVGLTRRIRQISRFRPHGWKAVLASSTLASLVWLALSPSKTVAEIPTPPATTLQPPLPTVLSPEIRPNYSQIEIEAKFLTIPSKLALETFGPGKTPIINNEELQKVIRRLNQSNVADMLSMPKVTTKTGQKSLIQVVREFRYPTTHAATPNDFETRNVGFSLEVDPYIDSHTQIFCTLTPRVVDFVGFVNYGGGYPALATGKTDPLSSVLRSPANTAQVINQPIFETRETKASVTLKSGETAVLGDMGSHDRKISESLEQAMTAWQNGGHPLKDRSESASGEQYSLYVLITARLVDSKGNVQASSPDDLSPAVTVQPIGQANAPNSGLAYGTPVPGKLGYATSPYAPKAGYVDLRGFPPGTEVKCPYTGRLFLAP